MKSQPCRNCELLNSQFELAANKLKKDKKTPCLFAELVIDDVNSKDKLSQLIAQNYNILASPSLKLFLNGLEERFEFTEEKVSVWNILAFVSKKNNYNVYSLKSVKELEEFVPSFVSVIVLFGEVDKKKSMFESIALSYDQVQFAHCKSEECVSHYKVENGSVIAFKSFYLPPHNQQILPEIQSENELNLFVNMNILPLVSKFTPVANDLIFSKSVPGLFFFPNTINTVIEHYTRLANDLAHKVSDKLQTIMIDDIRQVNDSDAAKFFGVKDSDLPCIRIVDSQNGSSKYMFEVYHLLYELGHSLNVYNVR